MGVRKVFSIMCAAAAICLCSVGIAAEEYPSRPITWIVPTGPGSGIDTATRFVARKLEQDLGQPIIVKNEGAGSGIVALRTVKRAPADGYVLFTAGMSQLIVNPVIKKDLPYEVDDFKPVSGMGKAMFALVVPEDSPVDSLDALVAAGNAGELNAGAYSVGYQLYTEWLGALADFSLTTVNYSGGPGAVVVDLIGGRLDFAFMDAYLAHAQEGKLRALAVTGKERFELLPDVPTLQELGLKEYVTYVLLSVYLHADTPSDITTTLSEGLKKIMADEETKNYLANFGMAIMTESPEEISKFKADQRALLTEIAHEIGFEAH